MPFVQSIDFAREARIGRNGVSEQAFGEALARTQDALAWLRAQYADGTLPLLHYPGRHDDLAGIATVAQHLAVDASDIVFLGTGGSSLGAQALAQLAGYGVPGLGVLSDPPRLHFFDNLDPQT